MLDRFVGDWIVTEASPNPMQVQTNVWIRREGEQLAIFEDGSRELAVRLVSVDAGRGEVSLVEALPDSEVALTLQSLATSSTLDAVKQDIAMRWAGGGHWLLSGGHVPGSDKGYSYSDDMIATIRENRRRLSYRVDSGIHCYTALNFRYSALCEDRALSWLHFEVMSKFESVSGGYPDSHRTYQAAIRDLDACTDKPCIRQRYEAWARYLDENYPLQQRGD